MYFNPKLKIRLLNRLFYSFHFFGVLGFIGGTLLGVILCDATGLSISAILLLSMVGAMTFFVLAMGAKVITGKEIIVYYHHEIAILIVCSVVLKLAGWQLLPYLDVTLLGIATFLAFGRIGCFSVGCCHGRPAHSGVTYGHDHVKNGFTWFYEGVPLLPVQLIESAFVFALIISGTIMLLLRFPSGLFLTLYTVVYGAFRFTIEYFRGDPERPYFLNLSEAQWTTLLLIVASVAASLAGLIPFYEWQMVIAGLVFMTAIATSFFPGATYWLTRPDHVNQIAFALEKLNHANSLSTNVQSTKFGLNLSKGSLILEGKQLIHYTVSDGHKDGLNQKSVRNLAMLIKQLRHHKGSFEILQKSNGIFHIVFSP